MVHNLTCTFWPHPLISKRHLNIFHRPSGFVPFAQGKMLCHLLLLSSHTLVVSL